RIKRETQRKTFVRNAHGRNVVLQQQWNQNIHDSGVHVNVEMAVYMSHWQASSEKLFNLRSALVSDLITCTRQEEIAQSCMGWIIKKIAAEVSNRRRTVRWQRCFALYKRQM